MLLKSILSYFTTKKIFTTNEYEETEDFKFNIKINQNSNNSRDLSLNVIFKDFSYMDNEGNEKRIGPSKVELNSTNREEMCIDIENTFLMLCLSISESLFCDEFFFYSYIKGLFIPNKASDSSKVKMEKLMPLNGMMFSEPSFNEEEIKTIQYKAMKYDTVSKKNTDNPDFLIFIIYNMDNKPIAVIFLTSDYYNYEYQLYVKTLYPIFNRNTENTKKLEDSNSKSTNLKNLFVKFEKYPFSASRMQFDDSIVL